MNNINNNIEIKQNQKENNSDNNNKINNDEENDSDENKDESIEQNVKKKKKLHIHRHKRQNNINHYSNEDKKETNKTGLLDNKKKNPTIIKHHNVPNVNENYDNNNINSNNDNKLNAMNPKTQIIKKPKKFYQSVNKVFFNDYQQKFVKIEKISDYEKDLLEKEIVKEYREGNQHNLKDYCLNFIEENVLRLFRNKKLSNQDKEAIKYNIETILKICGEDKNKYYEYYNPNVRNKHEVDRAKSREALRNFRKEFGISEKEYNDEGIINRLEENGLDIYKTFQKIFGV